MFREDEKDIQNRVAKLNTSECIKKPETPDTIIIYSCIPQKHYNDVLIHGLKSYDLISKEDRYHALPGHNQCVFFRPGFWVSDDLLQNDLYIGIKVDPHKVKIANQEIRTLAPGDLNSKYLASAVSYDQFRLAHEKYSKESPRKFPYSDKFGQLIWLTYMDDMEAERKKYLCYIPEIAINLSEPIPPEMFAYFNKTFLRPEKNKSLLPQSDSTLFSSSSHVKTDKISIEEVSLKLSGKIPGLTNISSDPIGNIRLIFENQEALDKQFSMWFKINGLTKPFYPANCIGINKECSRDIIDTMLLAIPPRLSDGH